MQVQSTKITALLDKNIKPGEVISTTDLLGANFTLRKPFWEKNVVVDLQSQLSQLKNFTNTRDDGKENRRKLVVGSKKLEIRDWQLKILIQKSTEFIQANE